MNVLIVDDAPDIRLLVRRILELNGIEAREVSSGAEAIVLIARAKPDLVILDIQMPEMDGWETLAAIRADKTTRDIPVILCSVRSRDEDMLRGWRAECDGYVGKPFDVADLIEEVHRVASVDPGARARIRAEHIDALTKQLT